MAKAELKTKQTSASVEDFVNGLADEQQRADSFEIIEMMKRATGDEPKMWGPAIIGFGQTTLKYDSGRELDWMKIGFSPRKANLTLYCLSPDDGEYLERLGKYKMSKGCFYIKRLSEVDTGVLEEMINATMERRRKK